MINRTESMYDNVQFCVKCGKNEVTEPMNQTGGGGGGETGMWPKPFSIFYIYR
jgi:hypothetical protein